MNNIFIKNLPLTAFLKNEFYIFVVEYFIA